MNIAIHKHDSDEIRWFLKDCVKNGRLYVGSNAKVAINPKHWTATWTDDDVNPVLDSDGEIVGWDKKVSDLTKSANHPVEKSRATHKEYQEAFRIRQLLDRMTYQGVEDHIESNITDLASAKVFLKRLSKVVLALAKIVDKEGQP